MMLTSLDEYFPETVLNSWVISQKLFWITESCAAVRFHSALGYCSLCAN